MKLQRTLKLTAAIFTLLCATALFSLPAAAAGAKSPAARPAKLMLQGGPRGFVHGTTGEPIEGIGVQLISTKSAIRTTVYSNEEGRYEFPVLNAGPYTLRVALPREYQPYVKEGVQISGATQLDNIVLERVSKTELLPPTPEILSQLTGAEWLMNIPGTAEQKRVLTLSCGFGCHSYQQIFRNRYDERSWQIMLQRMMRGGGSPLIVMAHPTDATPNRFDLEQPLIGDENMLAKWLSTVRGPDSKDGPMYYLPRPHGEATRVVITEYELPRELLAPHDVSGDSRGNIWYSTHRSPFQGELDPKTGVIKEVRVPDLDNDNKDILPGSHRVWVDKNDIAWFAEHWANHVTGVDMPRRVRSSIAGKGREIRPRTRAGLAILPWTMRVSYMLPVEARRQASIKSIPRPGKSFKSGLSRPSQALMTASSRRTDGTGRELRSEARSSPCSTPRPGR